MSTTVRHARPSLPQRIAGLFRVDARPQRPGPRLTPVRLPGLDAPLLVEVPGDKPREERTPAARPAWLTEFRPETETDLDPEETTVLASLQERVAEVAPEPLAPVTRDLLWEVLDGLRALDVSEPHTPDLLADLKELPAFRTALGMCTRRHAGECRCGHPVTGDTWGTRMVRAGIHILTDGEGQVA